MDRTGEIKINSEATIEDTITFRKRSSKMTKKRWQRMWGILYFQGRIHRTLLYAILSKSETTLQNRMEYGESMTVNFVLMPKFQWRCWRCLYSLQHWPKKKQIMCLLLMIPASWYIRLGTVKSGVLHFTNVLFLKHLDSISQYTVHD